jgi:cytochrome c oxidase subunit 3
VNAAAGVLEARGGGEGLRAVDPRRLGLWVFLATITMLFAAFSSAYLVRMSTAGWDALELPAVLWLTTLVIVASSATLELAVLRHASPARWLVMTLALGLVFLGGQALAWRALHDAGVFLPQSPHAAFLYIFTALHGAHLAGGLIWLAVLAWASPRRHEPAFRDRVARCAVYWHFLAGLWVYLFAVLHLG